MRAVRHAQPHPAAQRVPSLRELQGGAKSAGGRARTLDVLLLVLLRSHFGVLLPQSAALEQRRSRGLLPLVQRLGPGLIQSHRAILYAPRAFSDLAL